MDARRATLVVAALALCAGGVSVAQGLPPGVGPDTCDQLAKLPNPPISVEACKAMLGLAKQLDEAANDPRGRRPGDDALSCRQIFDELKSLTDVGLSKATTERMESVAQQGEVQAARSAAEMTAFMVETTAVGVAIGAMSAVVPNFVGAAIAAAWQARAVAFAAKQQAEAAKLSTQLSPALGDAAKELAQAMQADPRFARLSQLAMQNECEPPPVDRK